MKAKETSIALELHFCLSGSLGELLAFEQMAWHSGKVKTIDRVKRVVDRS
jgi:hypothetical protein